MRIVYGANFKDHTDVIFQDLHILKFCDLGKIKTCEVLLPVNLNNIFTVCEPNCLFNIRNKIDFVQKYIRTNLKAMSVSVVGAQLWNELDSNLRNTKSILLFKKKSNGVFYPRTYHIIEYFCFEKTLFDVDQINIINLVNDDCNLYGFSFKQS